MTVPIPDESKSDKGDKVSYFATFSSFVASFVWYCISLNQFSSVSSEVIIKEG